jgi:hypothetical protein
MYKVSYVKGEFKALFKWFKTFELASTFAATQPPESILEIKHYPN